MFESKVERKEKVKRGRIRDLEKEARISSIATT